MPTNKDFKRLVRGRMRKTGESYTSARAHLLGSKPAAVASARQDHARLTGTRDTLLKERTGRGWARWVRDLDRVRAHTWPHREIAKYVREKHGVASWWAQTVTVGYERIKGLRAPGQRRDGFFEASKSRTFAVSLARLYHAFHDPRTRARWLPALDLTVRSTRPEKSMRLTWPDRTSVEIGFIPRGSGKSQVAIQHGKLADRGAAVRTKQYWSERLDALQALLAGE